MKKALIVTIYETGEFDFKTFKRMNSMEKEEYDLIVKSLEKILEILKEV